MWCCLAGWFRWLVWLAGWAQPANAWSQAQGPSQRGKWEGAKGARCLERGFRLCLYISEKQNMLVSLGLHFLSFWPFGLSFLFILAFDGLISFHFPFTSYQKRSVFLRNIQAFYQRRGRVKVPIFGLLGLHFLSFLASCRFISFHFGILWLHFFSFWAFVLLCLFISFNFGFWWPENAPEGFSLPFWAAFPFMLGFWALISF